MIRLTLIYAYINHSAVYRAKTTHVDTHHSQGRGPLSTRRLCGVQSLQGAAYANILDNILNNFRRYNSAAPYCKRNLNGEAANEMK